MGGCGGACAISGEGWRGKVLESRDEGCCIGVKGAEMMTLIITLSGKDDCIMQLAWELETRASRASQYSFLSTKSTRADCEAICFKH